MAYTVRVVRRDGLAVPTLVCPGCGVRGDLDDDQFHGTRSAQCPDCGWRETADFSQEVRNGPVTT